MFLCSCFRRSSGGRWVAYSAHRSHLERGRIKSWGKQFVWVVFRQFVLLCRKLELFGGGRFEAFSTDVKDRSRKSRFSTFEWRSEFFIACGYSISWES